MSATHWSMTGGPRGAELDRLPLSADLSDAMRAAIKTSAALGAAVHLDQRDDAGRSHYWHGCAAGGRWWTGDPTMPDNVRRGLVALATGGLGR